MEFHIEKHSSNSVIRQIQEQIKIAVAMGVYRRGDTLPSIRDVEKQTGINRGLIHKAYLGLRKSGLLTLARGKGTVVAMDTPSPHALTEKCMRLSVDIISKARTSGISPTSFARYLSRHAQEDERQEPFIAYVDRAKKDAVEKAELISQMWQVPVVGLTIQELKSSARDGTRLRKVLTDFFMLDRVHSVLRGKRIEVLEVALRGTEQTKKALARIKANSSLLLILPPEVYAHASFLVDLLQKFITSRGIKISHMLMHNVADFEKVLNNSQYDLLLLSPGAHAKVPPELRTNPRILLMHMGLDPASLEAARILAGVII